jgi:hypothetical protein
VIPGTKLTKSMGALQAADKLESVAIRKSFVTGHDFSRAESTQNQLKPILIQLLLRRPSTALRAAIEVVPCYKTG